MIKLNRTYTDYNGVERNEDFYFNLSKAELLEMELSTDGGMEALINRIVNTQEEHFPYEYQKDTFHFHLLSYADSEEFPFQHK